MSEIRLLSTREVAARLGTHSRKVSRLVAAGRITPVMRLHGDRGAHLFDPADVEALRDEVAARLDRGES